MKLYRATLEAKGYLHFYATEYLKTTRVSDLLHNWALMFALNDVHGNPELTHLENLRRVTFYCTAATQRVANRRTYLRNPVPEDTGAGKMGLMEIEYYLPGSTFELHILSRDGSEPPEMILYGKKRVPCRIHATAESFRPHSELSVRPAHAINPLDYDHISEVSYAKKIPMRPSPVYYVAAKFSNILVQDRSRIVVPNMEESPQWN